MKRSFSSTDLGAVAEQSNTPGSLNRAHVEEQEAASQQCGGAVLSEEQIDVGGRQELQRVVPEAFQETSFCFGEEEFAATSASFSCGLHALAQVWALGSTEAPVDDNVAMGQFEVGLISFFMQGN